jgi:hypothetical protein
MHARTFAPHAHIHTTHLHAAVQQIAEHLQTMSLAFFLLSPALRPTRCCRRDAPLADAMLLIVVVCCCVGCGFCCCVLVWLFVIVCTFAALGLWYWFVLFLFSVYVRIVAGCLIMFGEICCSCCV